MHKILIAGAGKIGSLIACLLASSGNYQVYLADLHFNGSDISRLDKHLSHLQTIEVDVQNKAAMAKIVNKYSLETIISSLPFFRNIVVAEIAKEFSLNYFDLTEDINVTAAINQLAQKAKSAFVPQCGLAPGFVNIAAHSLMQHFDSLDAVKIRVGALPQNANNTLHYALTWSTDGLINEYANPCQVISNGQFITVAALDDLETLVLDGICYEAFNTSGGLGSLAKSYADKVQNLNYKTIRYPGHCEKMRFLMQDLKFNEDRENLKNILERSLPRTVQDEVIIYIEVTGKRNKEFFEETFVKKIYPQVILGISWSAIQIATASGICAVVDLTLQKKLKGLVLQEQFDLAEIVSNRFGKYYS